LITWCEIGERCREIVTLFREKGLDIRVKPLEKGKKRSPFSELNKAPSLRLLWICVCYAGRDAWSTGAASGTVSTTRDRMGSHGWGAVRHVAKGSPPGSVGKSAVSRSDLAGHNIHRGDHNEANLGGKGRGMCISGTATRKLRWPGRAGWRLRAVPHRSRSQGSKRPGSSSHYCAEFFLF
jgi:hypothetical protein